MGASIMGTTTLHTTSIMGVYETTHYGQDLNKFHKETRNQKTTCAKLFIGGRKTKNSEGGRLNSGLTKSRGFAWPQVLCPSPVGIFLVISRCDAFERKCDKSLGVEVQIVRQPARRADGLAIPWPDGLRFADSRKRL